jgi:flavin reductase (DIM6/NTAB) family NADH-FMN oxidoreductase RutF
MVILCVKKDSWSIDIIKKSKILAVSIFGEEQKELARKFLRRINCENGKINGVLYETHKTGAPILVDVPAFFECQVVNWLEGGDHDVLLCEIVEAGVRRIENSLTTIITGWKYGG